MLKNSRTVYAVNYNKDSLMLKDVPSSQRREDVEAYFYQKMNEGYIIYDVTLNTGFDALAGLTPGKYLCVWKDGNPGNYTILPAYITPHTDVIIMGIRLDFYNTIATYNLGLTLSTPLDGDFSKLKFKYCNVYDGTSTAVSGTYNASFEDCLITLDNASLSAVHNINTLDNCYISGNKFASYKLVFTLDTKKVINDNYINIGVSGSNFKIDITANSASASSGACSIDNTYIVSSNTFSIAPTATRYLNLNNCFIKFTDGSKNLNFNDKVLSSNNSVIYTNFKYNFLNNIAYKVECAPEFFPYDGYSSLDTSKIIALSGAVEMNANYSYLRRNQIGELGNIKYQYYNVDFISNMEVLDSFKHFDSNDVFLIQRRDLEAEMPSWSINNYNFYLSTTVQTYRNDESFLILAKVAATGVYGVFGFHKGKLYPTIYTSIKPNTYYVIEKVFHIWELPEELQYKNSRSFDNAPMEASFQVKDHTSRCIIGN